MAAIGFEVHIDKENDTPAPTLKKAVRATPLGKSFIGGKGKLFQPTPRKALNDVNNHQDFIGSNHLKGLKPVNKQPFSTTNEFVKAPQKPLSKQLGSKKAPQSKKLKKSSHPVQTKDALKSKLSVESSHKIQEPNDEEYDSDSIFPRSERLSSYVGKLLMWRPPCLSGIHPDSDSDCGGDLEDVWDPKEMIEEPVLAQAEEFDFSNDALAECLVDLPPLSPEVSQRNQEDELSDVPTDDLHSSRMFLSVKGYTPVRSAEKTAGLDSSVGSP